METQKTMTSQSNLEKKKKKKTKLENSCFQNNYQAIVIKIVWY